MVQRAVSYTHLGMAASMGAFLLSGGTKGKRLALPNAEIMIHQPVSYTHLDVYKRQLSRAILDPLTLTIEIVLAPRSFARRSAARESAVSPDCVITTTNVCSSKIGFM